MKICCRKLLVCSMVLVSTAVQQTRLQHVSLQTATSTTSRPVSVSAHDTFTKYPTQQSEVTPPSLEPISKAPMEIAPTLPFEQLVTSLPSGQVSKEMVILPTDSPLELITVTSAGSISKLIKTLPPNSPLELITVAPSGQVSKILETLPPLLDWVTLEPESFSQPFKSDPGIELQTPSAHPPLEIVSLLDEIGTETTSLPDRLLIIENHICEGICKRKGEYPHNREISSWPDCQKCHCDTMCSVFQDCCPDVLLEKGVTYQGEEFGTCMPETPLLPDDRQTKFDTHYHFFTQCPMDPPMVTEKFMIGELALVSSFIDLREDNDVIKCEYPNITDLEQFFPVYSRTTGISYGYRNIYCAKCHNDTTDVHKWRVAISCETTPSELLSTSRSKKDLFKILVTPAGVSSTGCHFSYVFPDVPGYSRSCSVVDSQIISACNVSGNVIIYDKRLDEACRMYTSIFMNKYNNMFCYLCNLDYGYSSLERFRQLVHYGYPSNAARLSFSALLDFDEDVSRSAEAATDRTQQSVQDCTEDQFYDPVSCECRSPSCSEGKYLTHNGTCRSLVSSNILGYRVCSELVLETNSRISIEDIDRFRQYTYLTQHNTHFEHVMSVTSWCPDDSMVIFDIVDYVGHPGTLEDIELSLHNLYETAEAAAREAFHTETVSAIFKITPHCSNNSGVTYPCSHLPVAVAVVDQHFPRFDMDQAKVTFLDYLETNKCPFVTVPMASFDLKGNDMYIFSHSKNSIERSKVDTISDSEVRICVPDYISMAQTDPQMCSISTNDFDTWTISGVVSIVCTCISLLCLLLTFATYMVFAPLRSGGGKTIMVLTSTLFAAQAFYEFTIEQFENETACTAFGITIHYTWLAALFSMNACTIERFYKLCFPLTSRLFFMSQKPFIMSTVYSFTCPLVIVAINVIVNLVTRNNLGYGSPTICYINNAISRIVAFAVPMAILVLVNLLLLLITIWSLRKAPKIEKSASSQSRIGLVACVRLSTVTGLTWLLTFLYEVIPSVALTYILTGLIGLQGVIFFLSMVLNKRVLGLYSKFFVYRTKSSSSGDQSSPRRSNENNGVALKHAGATNVTVSTSAGSANSGSHTGCELSTLGNSNRL